MRKFKKIQGYRLLGLLTGLGLLVGVPLAYAGKNSPPPPVEQARFSFEPVNPEEWTQTQDQVTVVLEVIDTTNYEDYSKVWRRVEYIHKDSGVSQTLRWTACQFPMFKAVVDNGSDQTLKLRSRASGSSDEVIVALDDQEGETLYAARKDNLYEGKDVAYRATAEMNGRDPDQMTRDLRQADEELAQSIPFLTDDATVLPSRKSTFYVCFKYAPWGSDGTAFDRWMRSPNELVLGLYDVPVSRDESGAVLRKTRYEFKVKVAEWKWIYRYAWDPKARTWWVQEPEIQRVR